MNRLLLFKGVKPSTNECPGYNTKQSDGEAPVMPGMVAPDRILSMSQIELNSVLMLNSSFDI